MKMRHALACSLAWAVLEMAGLTAAAADAGGTGPAEWFRFQPPTDSFSTNSAIDLRWLNESFAGEHGFIAVRNGQFVHSDSGRSVRFWAVNGPPQALKGEDLRRCARLLAKYGVNLVRVHGAMFDKDGETDPAKIRHAQEIVAAMKAEGIYTLFSIYFPLWFTPRADHPWLEGYDGKKHPFAALFFNAKFQAKHREWLKALLTTPGGPMGRPLLDEPAVFGVEIQNEDSLFFWTFSENNLPDPQLRELESQFGAWLKHKHGSIEAAFASWNGIRLKRDLPAEGRVGFRPLWNVFHDKTARDRDTAAFLLEIQTQYYAETIAWLRRLGCRALVEASNWTTASPEVFGPLEKLSYTTGDFLDRHGYFSCDQHGDNAEWSIRPGHTYADRSALRFGADDPNRKQFVHPVMDPHYQDKPSIISETTFNRPNRYRSEAPLYYAAYGALQGTDGIVHFAFDGAQWSVKPGYWMQPWTLASPAMLGQFPAAALLYRRSLLAPGAVLAEVKLNTNDLQRLQGTPLPQDAAFDELRLKDVPQGADVKPGQRLDPLIHYAGRTRVTFTGEPTSTMARNLKPFIDHGARTVTSSTGELRLDYGRGVLTLDAPQAQGASGALRAAGRIELRDLWLSSDLDLAHLIVVSLDDRPLASSHRMLLQALSEEKTSGFETEPAANGSRRITNIGHDPWLVKNLSGIVGFKRADATALRVTALDLNGYPQAAAGSAREIKLQPACLYYLIER